MTRKSLENKKRKATSYNALQKHGNADCLSAVNYWEGIEI